jgi:peptide/nickel transport system permease protein
MGQLAWRLGQRLVLLVGISVCSFVLLSLAPANFFDDLKLNPQISPATVSALQAQYGANRPLPERYARWLQSIARGDWGYSLSYHRPVGALVWQRARNTLLLTTLAVLLAWMLALPWGVAEALYKGGWIDRAGEVILALLLATPDVIFALLLLLFAARTGWFPTGGMSSSDAAQFSFTARIWDLGRHLFLPVLALALTILPVLARHVRSAMVGVLDAPFLMAAKGHGIPKFRLLYRHALPVALNSLISLFGFSIGSLLSISLLVEVILSWPGLGPLVVEAVLARDIYVVVAATMFSAMCLIAGNLLADFLLYCADPRIRTAHS